MIFETHAHYDDDRFNDDRDELLLFISKAIDIYCNKNSKTNI